MPRLEQSRDLLWDGGLVVGVVLFIVAVTVWYISGEHTFYFWDAARSQNLTLDMVAATHKSLGAALLALNQSMASDYNLLFTLPLVPIVRLFGESRLVFELGLALVYLGPFSLSLGAIATQLIPTHSRAVFWTTVALALLTPMTWIPTLRGYPDVGAACFMGLALWIYLRDVEFKSLRQIPVIGILLGSAILFRRHFAYAVLAFYLALSLYALLHFALQFRTAPRAAIRTLLVRALFILLTGITTALVLVAVARPFLERALTTNYNALYASFAHPWQIVLQWFGANYGWLAWLLVGLGFTLGIVYRTVRRETTLFVILYGGVTCLLWTFWVREEGLHYTLHTTVFVVLGMVILGWTAYFKLGPRRIARLVALAAGGGYVFAALAIGLGLIAVRPKTTLGMLFPKTQPPIVEQNYDTQVLLINYLRTEVKSAQPIYVASRTTLLNQDIVRNGERTLYGGANLKLNVQDVPTSDSRDSYPLEKLLQAKYVVVLESDKSTNVQERQKVVQVAMDLFKKNEGVAQDFVQLPTAFALKGNAVIKVYKRTKPTLIQTALSTFDIIKKAVPRRPVGQLDWMMLNPTPASAIHKTTASNYLVKVKSSPFSSSSHPALLYIGSVPQRGTLSGSITFQEKECAGVVLRMAQVDAANQITPLAEIEQRPLADSTFTLPFANQNAVYLLFEIVNPEESAPVQDCTIVINSLHLASE